MAITAYGGVPLQTTASVTRTVVKGDLEPTIITNVTVNPLPSGSDGWTVLSDSTYYDDTDNTTGVPVVPTNVWS